MTIYINIGSNQGDSKALIERAVALLAQAYPGGRLKRSEYFESASWGYVSPHPFLNLGVAIDVDASIDNSIDPKSVLSVTQSIQRAISDKPHRDENGGYCDRELDIDIIAIDTVLMEDEQVTLPHPRAHLRDFVMVPMSQLAPPSLCQWIVKTNTTRS